MDKITLDQKFIEKIKKIVYLYNDKIPNNIHMYYREILEGKDLDIFSESFSIPKEKLVKMAKICKLIELYNDISEFIELMDEDEDINEDEYKEMLEEMQEETTEVLSEIDIEDEEKKKTNINGNYKNLLIYPDFIDESQEATLNAQSGKETQTRKFVGSLIEQLAQADYYSLRKKGYVHQNQEMGNNKSCYIDGNAFERVGRSSTKVNYVRISLSENNRKAIKELFNIDFDMLYLIISYGDFKNEGIDELRYYNKVYIDVKKHNREILDIINIFKNDFTSETLPLAIDIINNSIKTIESLSKIIRNKQSNI